MTVEDRAAAGVEQRRTGARLEWVDAARGYCVAAVVLAHVVLWHVADPGVPVDDVGASAWDRVYGLLGSARMPMLLAVSGLVLARRVRAGFREGGLLLRSGRSYYLYVVWLLVYAVFYAVVRDPDLPHRVDGPLDVLRQLVVPETTLWYVFALAVYTAVLGLVHRVPPAVVLVVLALLTVVVHVTTTSDQVWSKVPELFFFFALGVYGARLLRVLADRASLLTLALTAVVAVLVTAAGRFVEGNDVAAAVLFLVRCTAFLALTVTVVAIAVRWSPARRLGVALGRRTLPVYVIHPLLLALLVVAEGSLRGGLEPVLGSRAGALLYPAVVTVVVVALCLAVDSAVVRLVGEVPLFAMPRRWALVLDRPSAATVPTTTGGPAARRAPTD